jgi:Tfp pilus assembly protein PilN
MRPVNLIPAEERRGDAAPLRAGIASYVVLGVLTAALLAVVAIVLTGNSITEKKAQIASLQQRQTQAEAHAAELAPYNDFASVSQSRVETVKSLADSRFDWERVLHELALVIPDDVWLETMSGTVAPGVSLGDTTGDTGSSDPSITGPSLHIIGCGRSQDSVAKFIGSVQDIDGVTRVGVKSSELGEATDSSSQAQASEPGVGPTGTCQTKAFIAKFDITVAFDAVPASAYTPGSTIAPTTVATGTTGTTGAAGATTTTTDGTAAPAGGTATDGGTTGAATDEASGNASAQQQVDSAQQGAANVGVGN